MDITARQSNRQHPDSCDIDSSYWQLMQCTARRFEFIRTHRLYLVNKIHIVGMDADGSIAMTNESPAAVSRRKRKNVINEIADTIQAA